MSSHHTVTLPDGRGGQIRFPVAPRQTLLQAALAAGLNWPSGCRVGICGSCRCRVDAGRVRALADFSRVLDGRQVAGGYVLACRSLVETDLRVGAEHLLPDSAQACRAAQARITLARQVSPTVMLLGARLDRPLESGYEAGQYTRLSVPGRVPPRCFSFATACRGDRELLFHVRLFPGGRLGGWLTGADRRGDTLQVDPPLGEFVLRERRRPLLFMAGGTGLAPVLAMLEELAADPLHAPPVRLVYAARDRAHLYAEAEVRALARRWPAATPFSYLPVLSREPAGGPWAGLRGHVFDHLGQVCAGFDDADVYLCGPPGLVDALELFLIKRGTPRDRLHADRFLAAY